MRPGTLIAIWWNNLTTEPKTPRKLTVRKIANNAHWAWLGCAWSNLLKSRRPSLFIGLWVVLISLGLVIGLYLIGLKTTIPIAYGSFIMIGPLVATFVYGVAREVEKEGGASKLRKIDMQPNSKSQLGFIGFTLLFLAIVWAIFAHLLWSLTVGMGRTVDESQFIAFILSSRGIIMTVIGTIIGGILATICFSIAAISLPLAFDRNIDALSAMALSVQCVIKNPIAMLSWGFMVGFIVVLSAPLAFLPIIVVFPWLGHSAWCAYRAMVAD